MLSLRRTLRAPLGSFRTMSADLKRLLVIGLVESAAVNAYAAVIAPWAKQMGYGADVLGILTAVLQIVSAVVSFGSGFLADWLGRRRMYTLGQMLRCAVPILLLTMHNYAGLVLVFVVRGLCAVQGPAQQGIFAAHTSRGNRATMLGIWQALWQLASVLVPVTVGVLAERCGVRLPFVIGAVLCTAATLVGLGLHEQPSRDEPSVAPLEAGLADPAVAEAEQARTTPASVADTARISFRTKMKGIFAQGRALPLTLLLLAGVANGLANGATNIVLPYTVMDRFSSGYVVVTALSSVMAFGSMVAMLFGGRLADRNGRRSIVMITGSLFPLLMAGILFAGSVWMFAALLMLVSLIGNASSPAISAVYMEAVPDEDRSTFSGVSGGLTSAATALGAVLGGRLYAMNLNIAWIAVIVCFALQVPCYFFALPADRRKTAPGAAATTAAATAPTE